MVRPFQWAIYSPGNHQGLCYMHALFQVAQSHLENYYCYSQNVPPISGINPLPNMSNLLVLQAIGTLKLIRVHCLNKKKNSCFLLSALYVPAILNALHTTSLNPRNNPDVLLSLFELKSKLRLREESNLPTVTDLLVPSA